MVLGSTKSLTEMSTRNISWGKDSRCVGLTNLLLSCADYLEIWKPEPTGALGVYPGLCRDNFTFTDTDSCSSILLLNSNFQPVPRFTSTFVHLLAPTGKF
jgi:hypothetical protein